MNPCVIRWKDEYRLYYAGADNQGFRRIGVAIAPVANPDAFKRIGPVLDVGPEGAFDARWTVLPHVVSAASDRWHLYYTGNCGRGEGLSAFPGIGLAFSTDGIHWEKYQGNPILAPTGRPGDPDRYGIAGGSVLIVRLPNGASEWRFYYTGCPSLGTDVFQNQQKICCWAGSSDGIHWERRGPVLFRDPDREYENVAVAGPVVHQEEGLFRMWYSAIGTRWGGYSIAYAESPDGVHWTRGNPGDNLQMAPVWSDWEWQMVEYPCVLCEGSRLRLFYCGNGYGKTGIGTALSCPIRAVPCPGTRAVRLVTEANGQNWLLRFPPAITCSSAAFAPVELRNPPWHGPTATGELWQEVRWKLRTGSTSEELFLRSILRHIHEGLEIRLTFVNHGSHTLRGLAVSLALEGRKTASLQLALPDLPAEEAVTLAVRITPDSFNPETLSMTEAVPASFSWSSPIQPLGGRPPDGCGTR